MKPCLSIPTLLPADPLGDALAACYGALLAAEGPRLTAAAAVVSNLSEISDTGPERESQARPLAALPGESDRGNQ